MQTIPKQYGHFDDQRREYVITDPATPWPWINYLGTDDFFSLISNTAGGYCFCRDARYRRILRYRYNGVPMDSGGRYFYIKDGDTVWNPGWKPCRTPLDFYECRHGMGYTRITGEKYGLRIEPCLPESFGTYRIRRRFRDATYELTIHPSAFGKQTFLPYAPGKHFLEIA